MLKSTAETIGKKRKKVSDIQNLSGNVWVIAIAMGDAVGLLRGLN